MPYGQGRQIGSTINPALGRMDFSGYERGGAAVGQGIAQLGAGIGDAIKMKKEMEKEVKKGDTLLQTAEELGIPIAGGIREKLNDPNVSLRDQYGIVGGLKDSLALYAQQQEARRQDEMLNLRKQAMAARGAGDAQAPLPPSAGRIQAALELMGVSGYGPQADVLRQRMSTATSPEEQLEIASMITGYASELGPSKLETSEERRIKEEQIRIAQEKLQMEREEASKPEKAPRPSSLQERKQMLVDAFKLRNNGREPNAMEMANIMDEAIRTDPFSMPLRNDISSDVAEPKNQQFSFDPRSLTD